MPDIVAANVTYTPVPGGVNGGQTLTGFPPRYRRLVKLAFGNNSLTYPTGGVPLTAAGLGLPDGVVESVRVIDQGTNAAGFKIEWVQATNKLRFMVEDTVGTNTPLKEHTNATFVPNPATILVEAIGH
jgi:hypothetical protein